MAKNGGKCKGAGRPKGSTNKGTATLKELIADKYPDFNAVLSMIDIAVDKETSVHVKVTCLKEVAKYTNHQLKAIEVTGDLNTKTTLQTYVLGDGTEIIM